MGICTNQVSQINYNPFIFYPILNHQLKGSSEDSKANSIEADISNPMVRDISMNYKFYEAAMVTCIGNILQKY